MVILETIRHFKNY